MPSTFLHRPLAAALAALALAATTGCGGGGGAGEPQPAAAAPPAAAAASAAPRLFVVGDSLADVGTFGLKATVQNAADRASGYPVFPELVANELGAARPCNFFASSDGRAFTTRGGCTGFAVGGALIRNPVTRGGSAVPFSIEHQLERAVAAAGGGWRAGDLVLVDGGGNDAAALAEAFLDARDGGAADDAVFAALLAQELDASALARALAQADGRSTAAGLYMERLAQTFWSRVKAHTLDRGARRVALVDIPDLTLMPRFRTRDAALRAALRQWIVRFNTELARLAAGDPRVVLVPYFDDVTAHSANPARFGLTNASDPACPQAADFPADCTDAALDAAPPAGFSRGWWRTWAWSDEFHPSPRGHELLAATVLRALAAAGWR
ncbi:MAG TPA: SGNH/GDSL hydrolase family protein [Ramlibacter sp.]|nr:SGNH/GDSL hydrolase family protein [Ramlibacter sp.]